MELSVDGMKLLREKYSEIFFRIIWRICSMDVKNTRALSHKGLPNIKGCSKTVHQWEVLLHNGPPMRSAVAKQSTSNSCCCITVHQWEVLTQKSPPMRDAVANRLHQWDVMLQNSHHGLWQDGELPDCEGPRVAGSELREPLLRHQSLVRS
jgi:hypothetical protein